MPMRPDRGEDEQGADTAEKSSGGTPHPPTVREQARETAAAGNSEGARSEIAAAAAASPRRTHTKNQSHSERAPCVMEPPRAAPSLPRLRVIPEHWPRRAHRPGLCDNYGSWDV
jgi:hypothetical protein